MSLNSSSFILENYHNLLKSIENKALKINKSPPQLLIVSKTRSIESIELLYNEGARDFGENYPSEAIPKIEYFNKKLPKNDPIRWHYIGHIQSRASKNIANFFHYIHSIDRVLVANKLNLHAKHKINALIQLNISNEQSKSGIEPSDETIEYLQSKINNFSNISIKGIMIIPAPNDIDAFSKTKKIFDRLAPVYKWDTLSMGMSHDFIEAINQGATIIRIGSLIFEPQ